MLLLDTKILIDVLRGEAVALAWLESFPRLPLDGAITAETVRLRQRHGLKLPDAIILATARCGDFSLATRNVRAFPPGAQHGQKVQEHDQHQQAHHLTLRLSIPFSHCFWFLITSGARRYRVITTSVAAHVAPRVAIRVVAASDPAVIWTQGELS